MAAIVRTNQVEGCRLATGGLVPFKASALTGWAGPVLGGMGMLPDEWRAKYRADESRVVYVVRSYATPIGWAVSSETDYGMGLFWVVPPVKYSVTTSRHQGYLRRAILKRGARLVESLGEIERARLAKHECPLGARCTVDHVASVAVYGA